MQAVRFHEPGSVDVLRIDDIARPEPNPTELLVDIRAASINPVDAKLREKGVDSLPSTTGSDFAGVIEATGKSVTDFEIGDRVFGTGLHSARFTQGSFTEFVAVPTDIVATLPDDVSFEQGAAWALVGVTAWRALVDHANLSPGEDCMIHGGTGGVGHIAVQLASLAGARVIATAGSDQRVDRLGQLGADLGIRYDRDDLVVELRNSSPTGFDVIMDLRVDDYLSLDIEVAGFGARVVGIGGYTAEVDNASTARGKDLTIHWMSMSNLAKTSAYLPPMSTILRKLTPLMENGEIEAHIDGIYGLEDAAHLHEAVLNDHFVGKLVVTV